VTDVNMVARSFPRRDFRVVVWLYPRLRYCAGIGPIGLEESTPTPCPTNGIERPAVGIWAPGFDRVLLIQAGDGGYDTPVGRVNVARRAKVREGRVVPGPTGVA